MDASRSPGTYWQHSQLGFEFGVLHGRRLRIQDPVFGERFQNLRADLNQVVIELIAARYVC